MIKPNKREKCPKCKCKARCTFNYKSVDEAGAEYWYQEYECPKCKEKWLYKIFNGYCFALNMIKGE